MTSSGKIQKYVLWERFLAERGPVLEADTPDVTSAARPTD